MEMDGEEALALGGAGKRGRPLGVKGGRLGQYRDLDEFHELEEAATMEARGLRANGRGLVGVGKGGLGLRGRYQEYEEDEELGGGLLDEELYEDDVDGYGMAAGLPRRLMPPHRPALPHGFSSVMKQLAAGVLRSGMGCRGSAKQRAPAGEGAGLQDLNGQMQQMLSTMKMLDQRGGNQLLPGKFSGPGSMSYPVSGSDYVPVLAFAHRDLLKNPQLANQPILISRGGNVLGVGRGAVSRGLANRLMAGGMDEAAYEDEAEYEDEEGDSYVGLGEPQGMWMARGGAPMRSKAEAANAALAAACAAAQMAHEGPGYEGKVRRWGSGGGRLPKPLEGRPPVPLRLDDGPAAAGAAAGSVGDEEYEEEAQEGGRAHLHRGSDDDVPASAGSRPRIRDSRHVPPARHEDKRGDRDGPSSNYHTGGAQDANRQLPKRDRKLIVPCPPEMVKHIIGRGGETIRGLQASSGANIYIYQDNIPPDKDREVRITGAADRVDVAERMVTEIIDNGENKITQQLIGKVLALGSRHHGRDYPEHYRAGKNSGHRSPEPDRHRKGSNEKGFQSESRWAHDKFRDKGSDTSSDSTPPHKKRP